MNLEYFEYSLNSMKKATSMLTQLYTYLSPLPDSMSLMQSASKTFTEMLKRFDPMSMFAYNNQGMFVKRSIGH
jgi:hypothetical protein